MNRFDLETLHIDVQYALRRCRVFGDASRAADALERVEERLSRLLAEEQARDDEADPMAVYARRIAGKEWGV